MSNYESQSNGDVGLSGPLAGVSIQGTERNVPIVWVYPATETTPAWVAQVGPHIIDLSVSYSISAATAITFSIIDPGLKMTLQNYFQIGQTIVYRSHNTSKIFSSNKVFQIANEEYKAYFMEVADVRIEQSGGNSPIVTISCYTKAIQQMKRDKKPGAIKGTASDYVKNAAKKYGLQAVVQKTSATRQISSGSDDQAADSVWTVLTNLASESKDEQKNPFLLFESDGILYFCSQQWLMYKWGHDSYDFTKINKKTKLPETTKRYVTYLHYPSRKIDGVPDNRLSLLQMPTFHKAENDPREGDGSCVVDRLNGVRLRPGMTVNVGDVPWFTGDYLIQSVTFSEMVSDPVNVSFSTPPVQEKQIKQIEVGKIYPGDTSWATIEGLIAVQPSIGLTRPPNGNVRGTQRPI